MLFPSQTNHDSQSVRQSKVKQPTRRDGVRSHRIDSDRCHVGEVALHTSGIVICTVSVVWSEGAVSDAFHKQLLVAYEQESAVGLGPKKPLRIVVLQGLKSGVVLT